MKKKNTRYNHNSVLGLGIEGNREWALIIDWQSDCFVKNSESNLPFKRNNRNQNAANWRVHLTFQFFVRSTQKSISFDIQPFQNYLNNRYLHESKKKKKFSFSFSAGTLKELRQTFTLCYRLKRKHFFTSLFDHITILRVCNGRQNEATLVGQKTKQNVNVRSLYSQILGHYLPADRISLGVSSAYSIISTVKCNGYKLLTHIMFVNWIRTLEGNLIFALFFRQNNDLSRIVELFQIITNKLIEFSEFCCYVHQNW